ncbi:MAG: peptidylprolyl isomerase [Campylobacterota bacterium]|nr:peptidylprolyl isomerase [Campylobacterota bacterium]
MSVEISKVISIEYTLKDANTGEQLDSNVGGHPLEFISGKDQIIPGLESKLVEMEAGSSADVLVTPDNAYGEYNDEAVQSLPKEQFAGVELEQGMTLYGTGEQGETVQVLVKSFNDTEVEIDYNHPMAGRTLMFTVAILSERAATEEEVETGVVGGVAAMGGSCCSSEGAEHEHKHDNGKDGGCCGGGSCS